MLTSLGRGERGHIGGDVAADADSDGLAVDDLRHRRVAVVLRERVGATTPDETWES